MRKAIGALVALALAVAAAPATAHVDVLPVRAADGQPTEFTVRVPTERDIPTRAVTVRIPPSVTAFSVAEPPPGWRVRERRSVDGRLVAITWSGGRIGVGRFQDFSFLGTPFGQGTAVWESEQVYADGITKPWTDPPDPEGTESPETGPDEPGPAAALEVVAADELVVAGGSDDDGSGAAIWLGVIAIAVAALAALGVGLLWSTRPMRLPEDEDGS
ncbi:MAG: DUF1775 domain-containing protein [Miltoncostaeaceae bacterium]